MIENGTAFGRPSLKISIHSMGDRPRFRSFATAFERIAVVDHRMGLRNHQSTREGIIRHIILLQIF